MSSAIRPSCSPLVQVTHVSGRSGRLVKTTLAASRAGEAFTEPGKGSGASSSRRTGGDWASIEQGGGRGNGNDYLAELGQAQDYNINVDHGNALQPAISFLSNSMP